MVFLFVLTVTGVLGLLSVGAVLVLAWNGRGDTPTHGGLVITVVLLALTVWGFFTLGALS